MAYTFAQFVNRANITHGHKYTYDHNTYTNFQTKTLITCPIHGEFEQTPNNHVNLKQGCPQCGEYQKKVIRTATTDFVVKSVKVHGGRYDYSKVNYRGAKTKVLIICEDHGTFYQTPNAHLSGRGCPTCGKENRKTRKTKRHEEFVKLARKIHKNKYSYNNTYTGLNAKMTITCDVHGDFVQRPNDHIHKQAGCPKCGVSLGGYNQTYFDMHPEQRDVLGTLYFVQLCSGTETVFKIGITKQAVERRVSSFGSHYIVTVVNTISLPLYTAFKHEQFLLQRFKSQAHVPSTKFCGHTECFNLNEQDVHIINTFLECVKQHNLDQDPINIIDKYVDIQ